MSDNKKFCVVGAGYWGKNHLSTLNDLYLLGGLVEKDAKKRNEALIQYPDLLIFSDLKEAINSKRFLGFTVATPAETHYEITRRILTSGYPVLVEKPFSLNLEDAKKLVKISEEKNLCIMTGHLLLFHNAITEIKRLIVSGALGKLRYIYSNRINFGIVRSHEDVFWSLAPHDISVFQYLIEKKPIKVSKSGHSFLNERISDIHLTVLEYPDMVKAHIFNSWYNPFKEHRLVVCGTEGMIDFKASHDDFFTFYQTSIELKEINIALSKKESERIYFQRNEPLKDQFRYFHDNIKTGERPLVGGSRSALETTEIMLEIQKNFL